MRLEELDYVLPADRIAQEPAGERTAARLLVLDRRTGDTRHHRVADLPALLRAGDLVVLNDTRVIPARTHARRPSGGRLEVLFVRRLAAAGAEEWEVLVRGGPRAGERVHFADASVECWCARRRGAGLRVAWRADAWLERVGEVPLPPYIRRPAGPTVADRDRYQTTYARHPGAVAAPTAGLHLTPALLDALAAVGVDVAAVTLHVGPGTFLPIRGGDLDDHACRQEYEISAEAADRGRRRAPTGAEWCGWGHHVRPWSRGGDWRARAARLASCSSAGHRFRSSTPCSQTSI